MLQSLWEKAWQFLKDYRWMLKYGKSRKIKLVNFVVSVLGLRMTAQLMELYLKNR